MPKLKAGTGGVTGRRIIIIQFSCDSMEKGHEWEWGSGLDLQRGTGLFCQGSGNVLIEHVLEHSLLFQHTCSHTAHFELSR
jgi:hypothetical protein